MWRTGDSRNEGTRLGTVSSSVTGKGLTTGSLQVLLPEDMPGTQWVPAIFLAGEQLGAPESTLEAQFPRWFPRASALGSQIQPELGGQEWNPSRACVHGCVYICVHVCVGQATGTLGVILWMPCGTALLWS